MDGPSLFGLGARVGPNSGSGTTVGWIRSTVTSRAVVSAGIVTGMELGFGGEVPDLYHLYRHGYPAAVIDVLAGAFEFSAGDLVVDVGCGTGQLTLPIAGRVRAVVGIDPEPAMLRRARQAACEAGATNVTWVLGADADLPAVRLALADRSIAAVTVGQALHWMDHEALFKHALTLVRPGGGVAVVTNGTPLWLQDSTWSRGLRAFLERWLDTTLTFPCGTDEPSQRRYEQALTSAGFEAARTAIDYVADLSFDNLVGGVYSALPAERLPAADQRPAFAAQVRAAVGDNERFSEPVHVVIITGRLRR